MCLMSLKGHIATICCMSFYHNEFINLSPKKGLLVDSLLMILMTFELENYQPKLPLQEKSNLHLQKNGWLWQTFTS